MANQTIITVDDIAVNKSVFESYLKDQENERDIETDLMAYLELKRLFDTNGEVRVKFYKENGEVEEYECGYPFIEMELKDQYLLDYTVNTFPYVDIIPMIDGIFEAMNGDD